MPYFFLYLFTSSRVSRVHHPALESLRTHIPAVLAHSKAPSTFKTYHGCFKRWKSWASGFPEVIYFPAQEEHVALYLISLVQSGSSYSSIQQAFYSISFFHNACGVSNPCKSAFLLAILEGCKRVASKPSKLNRVPILPEHLVALVNRFATPSASLGDIRDVCFCLLAFAGFLRFDELSSLRWSDISFFQDHIELYVSRSKVDQLGKGCTLVIASTGTPACPCAMLLRYAALARRNLDSVEFVFQNLSFSSSKGYSLRSGTSLSYTRAREVVLAKFRAIGVDTSGIGLHSLRIGGASAALNSGVPDHVIKNHGRWKSDSAKDLYCRENLRRQLLATSRIGL